MKKKTGYLTAAALCLLGLLLLAASTFRPITIFVDGKPVTKRTWALTTGQVLRAADLKIGPADRIQPDVTEWLGWKNTIWLDHASQVQVWISGHGVSLPVLSIGHIPANMLSKAGYRLFPGDRLYWNGQQIPFDTELPPMDAYTFQLVQAIPVSVEEGDRVQILYASGPTLGSALWESGIYLSTADQLSMNPGTVLDSPLNVNLKYAVSLQIKVEGREITALSAAPTVGQALADVGVSLQGLDYSVPGENKPLPEDGNIRVVRVHEAISLEQTTIPFDTEYTEDPNLELDQRSILDPGQYGISVSRVRIRYEDGQEVSREKEAEWVASEPKPQKIGYGTKVVIKTLDTPGGPVEYWRAVQVYATSYSPCRSGTSKCYNGTSSGLPVKRGVIGVTRQWYNLLAGQGVYIPGYGQAFIGDVGGGVPGKQWIDLAFTDDDFEAWHQNVTLYFLTPVPASIPWILP